MCGEVRPGHSSSDTDVYGALTDAGEVAAMGVRGYPRHMVRGNRVRPASVQSRLELVWTRPEMCFTVFACSGLANFTARPEKHSAAGAYHRF
jgi:hypothetical protein